MLRLSRLPPLSSIQSVSFVWFVSLLVYWSHKAACSFLFNFNVCLMTPQINNSRGDSQMSDRQLCYNVPHRSRQVLWDTMSVNKKVCWQIDYLLKLHFLHVFLTNVSNSYGTVFCTVCVNENIFPRRWQDLGTLVSVRVSCPGRA